MIFFRNNSSLLFYNYLRSLCPQVFHYIHSEEMATSIASFKECVLLCAPFGICKQFYDQEYTLEKVHHNFSGSIGGTSFVLPCVLTCISIYEVLCADGGEHGDTFCDWFGIPHLQIGEISPC